MPAQISSCDSILGTMEEMLGKFQNDLGNISSEIRALQDQSQSMSVRLRNRKAAELGLGSFLDSLALPAPLIDGILQPQSDAAFQARGLRCIMQDRVCSAFGVHILQARPPSGDMLVAGAAGAPKAPHEGWRSARGLTDPLGLFKQRSRAGDSLALTTLLTGGIMQPKVQRCLPGTWPGMCHVCRGAQHVWTSSELLRYPPLKSISHPSVQAACETLGRPPFPLVE